ncbi:MAG: glucosamine-6-phosphate isomerase [Firmicutes bacterium]|nr:glucosamine-6-phosphate isomerase [Candidatus Colimorpha enterica]
MDINLIKPEDLGKGSSIKLNVCDHEVDMYWKVAIEVLETIEENNKKGEPTLMVVPYGPLGPYARMVYFVNKYRISLKNCTFINMDEYIGNDMKYIPADSPLSFRGGMQRIFYSQIDDELNVRPENRYFPDPDNLDKPLELIKKFGKLDMVFGGVGINGRYAFNEPPKAGEACTNEEFLNRQTRILEVSRETRTINAFMNAGGNIEAIPQYCITIGMKEMFQAKKVRMCMPRDWNAGALRRILHGPVDCHVPCSLFQNHPDAMIYASRVALECPVPEIRVYNK